MKKRGLMELVFLGIGFGLFAEGEPPKPMRVGIDMPATAEQSKQYEQEHVYGTVVKDALGKIKFVDENPKATHERKSCVLVHVRGFTAKGDKDRIRIAVWSEKEEAGPVKKYGVEGMIPFRASSVLASQSGVDEANRSQSIFRLCGFHMGEKYSFFAHHDTQNGCVVRRILGIPVDPYAFSSTANQAKNPSDVGLKREGLGAPAMHKTLVTFVADEQKVYLNF